MGQLITTSGSYRYNRKKPGRENSTRKPILT